LSKVVEIDKPKTTDTTMVNIGIIRHSFWALEKGNDSFINAGITNSYQSFNNDL
jgi:hypothetical protein